MSSIALKAPTALALVEEFDWQKDADLKMSLA